MSSHVEELVEYIDASSFVSLSEGLSSAQRAVLDSINQKVAGAESLPKVMDFLFEHSEGVCPSDRIGLAFCEEGRDRVTAYWARSRYEPMLLLQGYSEVIQGSSLEGVLRGGQVRIIRDLPGYLEGHPDSHSTDLLVKEGVRSSMTCPLMVEGRTVGLLFRSSKRAGAFGREHVQMHLAVAERLSQAVEKAYRIEQLAEANKAYAEMLGFVSHELKNPLASIVMDAELLIGGYFGTLETSQSKKIQRMIDKSDYLLNLIRQYLDLARIEGGELEIQAQLGVDFVGHVVDPSIELVQAQLEQKKMVLEKDIANDIHSVECDTNLMKIVMVNLLGNAVKYGREKGLVKVSVHQAGMRLEVSVWNEGPGFSESQKSQLFRKFSRLQSPELLKQKGSGVGLYTSWRIVRLHGGVIRADSELGRWAPFSFSVPQVLNLPDI